MMSNVVKNKLFIVTIIILIYILTISVGYAFFKDSLVISGVASTVDYYEGTKLPTQAVIRDTYYNRYYTADSTKSFVDFESESWEGDTYKLYFVKKIGITMGEKTINYTVTFTNPTTTSFSNGTVSTEIVKNPFSRIKGTSATLSNTTVAPGESVDVTFSVKFDFLSELYEHEVKATVTYMYQNKPRYFYFIINYSH